MAITLIQHWQLTYLGLGLLCMAMTVVIGDHLPRGNAPGGPAKYAAAVTAGALWPVIVVGLTQFWLIAGVARRLRGDVPTTADTVGERVLDIGYRSDMLVSGRTGAARLG